jgi:hypothetical protein
MGSIIRFAHPRPQIRLPGKPSTERESREAYRALFILIGSFFGTALVMCAVVVAMVSKTWTDLLMISAFVFVFALLKVGLANALIYAMVRFDSSYAGPPTRDRTIGRSRSSTYKQPPKNRRTTLLRNDKLRVVPGQRRPEVPGSS